jgi:hypothetical protein
LLISCEVITAFYRRKTRFAATNFRFGGLRIDSFRK